MFFEIASYIALISFLSVMHSVFCLLHFRLIFRELKKLQMWQIFFFILENVVSFKSRMKFAVWLKPLSWSWFSSRIAMRIFESVPCTHFSVFLKKHLHTPNLRIKKKSYLPREILCLKNSTYSNLFLIAFQMFDKKQ